MKAIVKNYGAKLFFALVPLFVGVTNWFLAFAMPSWLGPVSPLFRFLPWVGGLALFFYRDFEYAHKHYSMTIGDYKIPLPSWKILLSIPIVLLIAAQCIYKPTNLFVQSIIGGILACSFFEEVFARSLFVKYKMGTLEFLCFNAISSCAFGLMHAGSEQSPLPWTTYLFLRGHIPWSLNMGLIVYKTQRIEFTMLWHSVSNLIRYTIPVLLFGIPLPVEIHVVLSCVEVTLLGLSSRRLKA